MALYGYVLCRLSLCVAVAVWRKVQWEGGKKERERKREKERGSGAAAMGRVTAGCVFVLLLCILTGIRLKRPICLLSCFVHVLFVYAFLLGGGSEFGGWTAGKGMFCVSSLRELVWMSISETCVLL